MAGEFDESKHPREKNGEFAKKDGVCFTKGDLIACASSENEEQINSVAASKLNDVKAKAVPKAEGFNRIKTKHHQRHVQEFGYRSEKEYIQSAIEFFNNGKGELYFNRKENSFYKMDRKNNIIAVCDTEGNIKSYYQTHKSWIDQEIKKGEYEKR